jgi:hypothetical protein
MKMTLHPSNPIIPAQFIEFLKKPSQVDLNFLKNCADEMASLIFLQCANLNVEKLYLENKSGQRRDYTQEQLSQAILKKEIILEDLMLKPANELAAQATNDQVISLLEYIRILPITERVQHLMFICLHEPGALFDDEKSIFDPWDEEFLGKQDELSELQMSLYTRLLACHDVQNECMVATLMMHWMVEKKIFNEYYKYFYENLDALNPNRIINPEYHKVILSFILLLNEADAKQLVLWLETLPELYKPVIDIMFKENEQDFDMSDVFCKAIEVLVAYGSKTLRYLIKCMEKDVYMTTAYLVGLCKNELPGFLKAFTLIARLYGMGANLNYWTGIFWIAVQRYCEGENCSEYIRARDALLVQILNSTNDLFVDIHFKSAIKQTATQEMLTFFLQKDIKSSKITLYISFVGQLRDKLAQQKIPATPKELEDFKCLEQKVCKLLLENDAKVNNIKLAVDANFPIDVIVNSMVSEARKEKWLIYDDLSDELLNKFTQYWAAKNVKVDYALQLKMIHIVADRLFQSYKKKNTDTPVAKFHHFIFGNDNQLFFQYLRAHINDAADLLILSKEFCMKVMGSQYASEIKWDFTGPVNKHLVAILTGDFVSIDFLFKTKVFNHSTLTSMLFKDSSFKIKYFKFFETALEKGEISEEYLHVYKHVCQQYGGDWLLKIVKNEQLFVKAAELRLFDLFGLQNAAVFSGQVSVFEKVLKSYTLDELSTLRDKNSVELSSGRFKNNNTLSAWQNHLITLINQQELQRAEQEKIVLQVLTKGYERAKGRHRDEKSKMAHSVATTVNTLLRSYPHFTLRHSVSVNSIVADMQGLNHAFNTKNTSDELVFCESLENKLMRLGH